MNETQQKELLQNLMTANILILAKCIKMQKEAHGTHGGDYIDEAIREIKKARNDLILKLPLL